MLPRIGTRLCLMVGALLVAVALLLGGCGGGGGGSSPSVSVGGTGGGNGGAPVGNAGCLQCHAGTPNDFYVAGDPVDANHDAPYTDAGTGIGPAYQGSVHNSPTFSPASTNYVKCEDCHGSGAQHFGVGPIANWAPTTAQCGVCHKTPYFDLASFQATAHNNSNARPDKFFFQGSNGTDQAASGANLYWKANQTSPVSKNEYIGDCSVCHSYAQSYREDHIADGNLSDPQVGCSACHDSHSPAYRNMPTLPTRTVGPDQVIRFKPQKVNNVPGQAMFGAINQLAGSWIRPTLHYVYGVTGLTNDAGYTNQVNPGDHLRLSSERLCAACHTQGKYKRRAWRGPAGGPLTDASNTHGEDVFTQYQNSGHGDKTQPAFEEFSLLAAGGSRRPQYPIDMGRTDGRINGGANNYTCYQCHHGIAAIDYINGVQGDLDLDGATTSQAHVLWGDSTHTCVTCHDPHKDANGLGQNVRVPKYLSYNSRFNSTNNPGAGNARGGLNKMMDGSDIPATVGNNIICLDCHQGRESGYTVYRSLLARTTPVDLYNGPLDSDAITGNISNQHYFAGGANVYSKNMFEYVAAFGTPGTYSEGIPQHTSLSCTGCHMAEASTDNTEGGHTWKPRIETCQTSGCHPGMPNFFTWPAPQNVDGDNTTQTVYQKFGVINQAATPVITDQGLFNILRYVLYTRNIVYNPDVYPYFTRINGKPSYTKAEYMACFNLNGLYKTGNAAYVHNYYYTSQVLIDALNTLGVTQNPNTGIPFERPVTPPGGTTRNAWDNSQVVIP